MSKSWGSVESAMHDLGIPTQLDEFISSFTEETESRWDSDAFEVFRIESSKASAFNSCRQVLELQDCAYVPEAFITRGDDSLATFLRPFRALAKAISNQVKTDVDNLEASDLSLIFSALSRSMAIQAHSPFVLCNISAIGTLRTTLNIFAEIVSNRKFTKEKAMAILSNLSLPSICFDSVMCGEIGFVNFCGRNPVSESEVEEWKAASKIGKEFQNYHRKAQMQRALPKLREASTISDLHRKCHALSEFRRLGEDFHSGRFTEIMHKKGLVGAIDRAVMGEGSHFSFEFCLKFERAMPVVWSWVDKVLNHVIDPYLPADSFENEHVKYDIISGPPVKTSITLKPIESVSNVISIPPKPVG